MWLITALLILSGPRLDETKPVSVVCPVDRTKFKAELLVRSNDWGGIDRDFCRHAYRTFPMEVKVWTCPGCRYSGTKADFTVDKDNPVTIDSETADRIRKGLKPAQRLPKRFTQRKVPAWVKFDLMAQSVKLRGRPAHEVGNAYLYAAWILRQRGVTYLQYFEEFEELYRRYKLDIKPIPLRAAKILNRADYELAKAVKIVKDLEAEKFSGVQILLARYLAAYLNRRHGENAEALTLIEAMKADLETNSIVKDAVTKMKESIKQERVFQRKALAEFEQALEKEQGLKPSDRGDLLYQLAELNRRLGNKKAAVDYYNKTIALEGTSEQTRKFAEEQQKRDEGNRKP